MSGIIKSSHISTPHMVIWSIYTWYKPKRCIVYKRYVFSIVSIVPSRSLVGSRVRPYTPPVTLVKPNNRQTQPPSLQWQ